MANESVDIQKAKRVIRMEAEAVAALEGKINDSFQKSVDIIFACKGRVVVTGMGKSGITKRRESG